jgi:peptidylprolyl isomerase
MTTQTGKGLLLALAIGFLGLPAAAQSLDPENTIVLKTSGQCDVTIKLRPDLAPKHVAQIKKLTRQGFYDGIVFHRVIEGFMAQTGDPTGTGMGGSKEPDIAAEFSNAHFGRGTVGMARSQDPNSANSQFFIMFADGGFLDGQYTVWGEVVNGMDCVDRIARGEPPAQPDKIVSMKLMKDIK